MDTSNYKKSHKSGKIAELGTSLGLNGNVYSSVNKAFKAAQADAAEDDFIFVGGSSYIVADFLSLVIFVFLINKLLKYL